jgi:eukaryotic-like serine/threonine-protein kinase
VYSCDEFASVDGVAHLSGAPSKRVGRYVLGHRIGVGGMAEVYLGRLLGPVGFQRSVAVKRLHPHLSGDPAFVAMFLDEVRLAASVQHPNVVDTIDVVLEGGEVFLVMEYVQGESLAQLLQSCREEKRTIDLDVIVAVISGALHGLHAAHQAKDEKGEPLHIVHRDVSPHNILVGVDGVARVLDFGVAKATGRAQSTRAGQAKGKLAYMSPEQLRGGDVDRRVDVYAAGIVLWEALTGRRLFLGNSEPETMNNVIEAIVEPPSTHAPQVPPRLDEIVLRALDRDPDRRFSTAQQMAIALEACFSSASPAKVGDWVAIVAMDALEVRARHVASIEQVVRDAAASGTALDKGARVTLSETMMALGAAHGEKGTVRDVPVASSPAGDAFLAAPRARSFRRGRSAWVVGGLGLVIVGTAVGGLRTAPIGERSASIAAVAPTPASEPSSDAIDIQDVPSASAGKSDSPTSSAEPPTRPTNPGARTPSASSATASSAGAVSTRRPHRAPFGAQQMPSRSSAGPATSTSALSPVAGQGACPIRSYVDQDGLLRFTRECSP